MKEDRAAASSGPAPGSTISSRGKSAGRGSLGFSIRKKGFDQPWRPLARFDQMVEMDFAWSDEATSYRMAG
jgi:hypothetical protein